MDDATRKRLVGLCFAEAQELLPRLEAHWEQMARPGEVDAAREFGRDAHTLKGSTAAVGLADLSQVMHGLEQLALDLEPLRGPARSGMHGRLGRLVRALQVTIDEAVMTGAMDFSPASLSALHGLISPMAQTSAAVPVTRLEKSTGTTTAEVRPDTADAATHSAQGVRSERPNTGSRSTSRSTHALERLTIPSEDVDVALGLAAGVARAAAALEEDLTSDGSPYASALQELAVRADRLEAALFGMRLIPVEEVLGGLDAEIEALAGRLGKRARVEVEGHEVRADRRTLEATRSLLRHLVRNALDHGLETPADREAAGKSPEGLLRIVATMVENRLCITAEDDGGGFDAQAIRARLGAESVRPDEISRLSDAEVVQRFAETGGSTRSAASLVSGRGLGLSAVAAAARARGGDFVVRSTPGKGSAVSFSLPLEVFATDVLTATVGETRFGIPLASVERTVFLGDGGLLQHGPNGMTLAVDERIVPVHSLGQVTGTAKQGAPRFALFLQVDGREAAFAVDDLGETTRVVPRAVPPAITAEALVNGIALLPDGAVVQLLNVRRLMEQRHTAAVPLSRPAPQKRVLEVLLAEDSLATREVLRVLLEEEGHRVRVAGDGEEALQRIAEKIPDVLVSDINMPRLDGIGLTKVLRARGSAKRLPIVLLTSQDDAETRKAGAAAGADAYLIKARFSAAVLRDTLTQLGFDA